MKQLRKAIEQITAFIMCMVLLTSNALADEEGPFPDVPADASYAEAVATLVELGILQGDESGNFNPDNTITRAEAAAIICRILGVEDEAKIRTVSTFSDVLDSHWAVGYIAKAAEIGIIGGYGNGKFGPSDPITQEQMVKMLVCAWGWGDIASALGTYPQSYIEVAYNLGIADNITIGENATRKVVAILCYNTLSATQYDEEL